MTGGTFDAALNAFAALELDARSMNLLHAGYGIGASIGPWMMTGAVALGSSSGWRAGMWVVATLAGAVAVILTVTRRAWALTPHVDDRATRLQAARGVVLAALALFFVYTGVEIVAGQYAFTFLSEGRGVSVAAAGFAAGGFWFGLTVSRLALGLVGGRLPTRAVVTASSVTAAGCLALLWWAPMPWVGLLGLMLAGLALGPIFPLNIALTPSRVGRRNTARMIGYQIAAANLGAASLPWLTGRAVDRVGLDVIGMILVTGAVALVIVDGVLRRLTPKTQ
jgi:fucose permease